jgi:hypothetical protein
MVIDSNLIGLIKEEMNRLEICRLETSPPSPRLQTACFLELPPLMTVTSIDLYGAIKEWVPTSRQYTQCRSSRGHHIPFYSPTVGTIALTLHYHTARGFSSLYRMIISVAGLLSVIRTGVRNIPWVDWGPSSTHLFETTLLNAAGPFWITGFSPLVFRDYGLMRTRYTQSMAEDTSSLQSRPSVFSTQVFDRHGGPNNIETYLPYRDIVANHLNFRRFNRVMADREWIVGIMDKVRELCVCTLDPSCQESDHTC